MSSRPAEESPVTPDLAAAVRRDISRMDRTERAYARFVRRAVARPRLRALEIARWVAVGMLLGAGSLYAASGGPFHARSTPPAPGAPEVAKPRSPVTRHGLGAPARITATAEAEAVPPPASSEAAPIRGPGPESWRRAARALRHSDLQAADDALARLSEQGSAGERDVVKLVRAQVLARAGHLVEARALLEGLSHSAQSAEQRAKAAELLRQLAANSSSHRSFEPEPHTK